MYMFRYLVCLLAVLFVLCGCSKDEEFVEKEAGRTLLLYIAGDNNLSEYGKQTIASILSGAENGHLNGGNLVIYFDSRTDVPVLLHAKEQRNGTVQVDTVWVYPEQNSMDKDIMGGVIHDVLDNFPAKSYGLILWSHGTAWLPGNLSTMLRSFGEDKNEVMEIEDLATTLPDHKFDFILFDACYMASVEVLYELRDKADYIIASPTEILSSGFLYPEIVRSLFADTPDLKQVCSSFYDYYNRMDGIYRSATISLSSMAEVEPLAEVVKEIVSGKEKEISQLPLDELQRMDYLFYRYHFLYDFDDFISRLATPDQYERFKRCLDNVVLFKEATPKVTCGISGNPQITITRYSGLSVYVPQPGLATLNHWYRSHTTWGAMLFPEPDGTLFH